MTQRTPEEQQIIDNVRDRMRGYPRKYLETLAHGMNMTYDELIKGLDGYIATGKMIDDSFRGPDNHEEVWRCYELSTGRVVPPEIRENDPFTCCA